LTDAEVKACTEEKHGEVLQGWIAGIPLAESMEGWLAPAPE
jgi:hypothetical protein